MKSSTSWPSTSRKYSAMVRPDRPTRSRAPGGSFICPYTSATELEDARLLELEVEIVAFAGPLAHAAEDRPAAVALLHVVDELLMTTVLPTPAPPKRPILPPFTNGAIRSMTLMPVSKMVVFGSRSTNFGVSRWIAQRSFGGDGGPPSTGSPSTLRIRPSAALPPAR